MRENGKRQRLSVYVEIQKYKNKKIKRFYYSLLFCMHGIDERLKYIFIKAWNEKKNIEN